VLYPASSLHGHAGYVRGVFFLAAEHGTGCPRPQPRLRSRHGDSGLGGSARAG
jgi:hypothetical protein